MATTTAPVAVLKFGGEVVADASALAAVMAEVAALTRGGWRFVLCHGGGPQANALQQQLGLEPVKVGGRRVTDEPTLRIMKMVLAGQVSVDVVAAAAAAGLSAVGVSGVSAGVVTARRRPPKVVSGGGAEPVDFGFVGDIVEIRPDLLRHLWAGGFTPVLNTLAIEPADAAEKPALQVFNINADTVSSAVAAALAADHLFLMTGVPGVLRDKDDPSTRIPHLDAKAARQAIADGVIVGGMIPKVEEALGYLSQGIRAVHILGATAGALAGEARSAGASGTVLTGP
ncbi:MAG: acetylglutamate kinase [Myxococcales bacterium FL481]|nr:MAG: acetylglutamate kinase [Myxococcales bacterium FL481]